MRLLCRSCHVTLHHAHESWNLVYLHAMRIMPHHPTCCHMCYNTNDVIHASCAMCVPASQLSQGIYDAPILLIGIPFMPTKGHLLKLTTSHFCTQNNENAKQNMMKRILIAMGNKNKANPLWTQKIKTKAKNIIISNILHLLSAAGPVPMQNQSQPVCCSFIHISKFSVDSNCMFDCCFSAFVHPELKQGTLKM